MYSDDIIRMQVIEGLSNDVVLIVATSLGVIFTMSWILLRRYYSWSSIDFCFILCLIYLIYRLARAQGVSAIHPDSEEVITATRQRLPNRPPRENDSDISCAICLGSVEYGLETNCAHLFCGT